jgi:hypothetical protein
MPFLLATAAAPFFLMGAAVVLIVFAAVFGAGFAAGFAAGFPLGAALDFLRGGEGVASFLAIVALTVVTGGGTVALALLGWGG